MVCTEKSHPSLAKAILRSIGILALSSWFLVHLLETIFICDEFVNGELVPSQPWGEISDFLLDVFPCGYWSAPLGNVWSPSYSLCVGPLYMLSDWTILESLPYFVGSCILVSLALLVVIFLYSRRGRPGYWLDVRDNYSARSYGSLWAQCAWRCGWVVPVASTVHGAWYQIFHFRYAQAAPVAPIDLGFRSWILFIAFIFICYCMICAGRVRRFVLVSLPDDWRRCRNCSYALSGLSESRCPECGWTFDPKERKRFRLTKRPLLTSILMFLFLMFCLLSPLLIAVIICATPDPVRDVLYKWGLV